MYDSNIPAEAAIVNNIAQQLNEHDHSKTHDRHFNIDFCRSIGLKIEEMESDDCLQDKILSVHHAYLLSLSNSDSVKIIESQNGKAVINRFQS